jgi:hypothetical protein
MPFLPKVLFFQAGVEILFKINNIRNTPNIFSQNQRSEFKSIQKRIAWYFQNRYLSHTAR